MGKGKKPVTRSEILKKGKKRPVQYRLAFRKQSKSGSGKRFFKK